MKFHKRYFRTKTTEFGHSDEHKGERKRVTRRKNELEEKSLRHSNKNMDQKRKQKLRHTRQWRELKTRLISSRGKIDELTGHQLTRDDKLTCHHMRLTAEKYGEFTKDEDFMLLTETTHRVVHWLWELTKGEDFTILEKLESVLRRMKELQDEDSGTGHVSDPHGRCETGTGREIEYPERGLADVHDYQEVC